MQELYDREEDATQDVMSHATFADGHPFERYEKLRALGGVCWSPSGDGQGGAWLVTGYAEADEVSRNAGLFCSGEGFQYEDQKFQAMGAEIADAMSALMINMDPPDHSFYKKLLLPYLSASALESSRPYARQVIDTMLDRVESGKRINLVEACCAEFPIRMLGQLMGVPESDRDFLMHKTNQIIAANDPAMNAGPEEAAAAFREVFSYGRDLVQYRRQHPADDMVSAIATAKKDGAYLRPEEVDGFFAFMVAAGNETTRSGISGGVAALAASPQSWTALRAEPERLRNAIDEMLRFHSPVIHMRRTATADTMLGGKTIARGDKIVMLYGAINRDPAVFPDADAFDIHRANAAKHFAFGIGIHRCIGAVLARMEMQEYFTRFLGRVSAVELQARPTYIRSNFVCSPSQVEVQLTL